MTFLSIVGGLIITFVCLMPARNLLWFYSISDYGFIDTTKWNWNKEKLWIEFALLPLAAVVWWFTVGTHIHIGVS